MTGASSVLSTVNCRVANLVKSFGLPCFAKSSGDFRYSESPHVYFRQSTGATADIQLQAASTAETGRNAVTRLSASANVPNRAVLKRASPRMVFSRAL